MLRKTAEISGLSSFGLDKLLSIATGRKLAKGDNILKAGQICRSILFVESGLLRTYVNKEGTEINTHFTLEGFFCTNLKSLRSGTVSDSSIQAIETSLVYEFNKDLLLNLYQSSSEIESFGRKLLEQLLVEQEEHSNFFKIYTPTERYHYLQHHTPELLQRVSLSQLSSYLGIARETLSRIRKK